MESEALLRRDGYAIVQSGGELLATGADFVDTDMVDLVLRTVWQRLDDTFHRSTLFQRWHPLRIVAMTRSSPDVNGSAGQVTDVRAPYFYIGLHAGLFVHTADRLFRVLAEPSALPDIGNAAREEAGRTGALLAVAPLDPRGGPLRVDDATNPGLIHQIGARPDLVAHGGFASKADRRFPRGRRNAWTRPDRTFHFYDRPRGLRVPEPANPWALYCGGGRA